MKQALQMCFVQMYVHYLQPKKASLLFWTDRVSFSRIAFSRVTSNLELQRNTCWSEKLKCIFQKSIKPDSRLHLYRPDRLLNYGSTFNCLTQDQFQFCQLEKTNDSR
jgi:hypothetical protein